MVIVDRYTNWPIIERAHEGSKGLIDCLRQTFATFGIPDELSTDGGLEFTAQNTRKFLNDWGVHHRVSSVAFPHSNCRAEVGVKVAKRIITDNTDSRGNLNIDTFQRAMLSYRTTPSADSKLSPAQCLFGRQIKDFIPVHRNKYKPNQAWVKMLDQREKSQYDRNINMKKFWSEHTKALTPLKVGDLVRVQNQFGNNPRKWNRTGKIIEVLQFDQYRVKIDGSNRATLRNRKFLRKYERLPQNRQTERRDLLERLRTVGPYRKVDQGPVEKSFFQNTSPQTPVKQPSYNAGEDVNGESLPPCQIQADSPDLPNMDRTMTDDERTVAPTQKRSLAVRRLDDFNKKGLKE